MYGMLKATIDRLDRKIDFVQKNTSKSVILVCTNLSYLTLWFLGKTLRTQNCQRTNFSGLPTTVSLCTQDSEYKVGLGDRPSVFEVIAAQSEVMVQKTVLLRKIRGVAKKLTLFFGLVAWKRIEQGVPMSESMFCLFPSNRMKNTKMLIFCNTAFASRQISKRDPLPP